MSPLMEEIRFERFGSPDYSVCLDFRLSDGDSVYSNENCLKFWGLPRKCADLYGDSFENLLEILTVVIILSLMFSVCGTQGKGKAKGYADHIFFLIVLENESRPTYE